MTATVESQIVSVNHTLLSAEQISLFPNPLSANQSLMLGIGADVHTAVTITILNVAGVQVAQRQIENVSGVVPLDIKLTPGVYVATVSVLNENVKIAKLVVE